MEVEDFKAKDDLMQEQLDKKDEEIKGLQLRISQLCSSRDGSPDENQQNVQDLLTKSADMEGKLERLQETLVKLQVYFNSKKMIMKIALIIIFIAGS